jgi:hypothetical protein
MATLIGRPWWVKNQNGVPTAPPSVNISISQEVAVQDAKIVWTTTHGRQVEDPAQAHFRVGEEPFVGRAAARTLHISEQADKKRVVRALVKVSVPSQQSVARFGTAAEATSVIGTFESKEIKIISKPSKKRQSNKSSDRESFEPFPRERAQYPDLMRNGCQ